jgi:two-component sensor histidine kinase
VRDEHGVICDFNFTYSNENGARLLNSTPQLLQGKSACDTYPVNRTGGFFEKYKRVADTGERLEEEFAIDAVGINASWLRYQVIKLNDGIALTVQDISSRKKDEAKMQETVESLRRSEARLVEVQHLARLGNWEVDLASDGAYEWSDDVYPTLRQDPREGPMSADQVIERIHPEDRRRIVETFEHMMNHEEPHEMNCRLFFENGDMRYIHGRARCHLDQDGRASHVCGITMDVTDKILKRMAEATAEKDALIKEVHHRVKNNLQVICSMLAMQAANAKDRKTETALTSSYDRVYAMAMVHEMLYGSDTLGDIDLREYARQLINELCASYHIHTGRIRTVINVFPLKLSIDRAIPCGLIMNELISNSLKHAFPDNRDGQITVSFAPDQLEHCQMVVEDSGVGFPEDFSMRKSHSLGLGIVDILVRQLNGTYSYSSENGTKFLVRFPV